MRWLNTRERDPRKPLRFDSPKAAPAYGIAWYRAEQWPRLREVSTDRDALESTHAEWLANATRRIAEMAQSGITLQKVDIDVEKLIAWTGVRNLPVNADTRSLYVEYALRESAGAEIPESARSIDRSGGRGGAPAAAVQGNAHVSASRDGTPLRAAPDVGSYLDERVSLLGTIRSAMQGEIRRAAALFVDTIRGDGTIYFFGNGGSAADAQHLSTELVERLMFDRRGFRAHALTTNTSLLTATANDRGYDDVFARQVEALARPGDLLVAISTSGKSPSVIRALEAGRRLGVARLGLSGKGGGQMPSLCDLCLTVPSIDTQQIQEAHIMIGHYLCMTVEAELAR